ncbi:MAG TPA: ABC transporter substrate-binding protein [Gemmatimonadaceae bacterium]|nr:ABC transporter substrate-binding protein [Gemmatimonadaceae bacterium]
MYPTHRLRLAGLLGGSILFVGITNCSRASAAGFGASRDTAYVGVAVGLQSPERYKNVFKGVQQALDELNANRPSGSPILAMRQAPANASTNVQVAAAFRDDPSVIGVVGHTESDATISAASVYDDREHGGRNAIVAVSPTAAAGDVTRASPWVFRVCPVVSQQASTLAHYITDSLHLHRIALVYRNDVAGREFLRTFAKAVDDSRDTLVERDPFVEAIAEFDVYAQRLARNKPDGVMIYANTSDVLTVMHAVHAAGVHPIGVSTNGPTPAEVVADGAAGRDFGGLRYLSLFLPDRAASPRASQFVSAFEKSYREKPDHWAALSYDAAMLIGRAAQARGADRRAIRDWIASVGNGQPAYAGASGEIRFDAGRNPIEKTALVATVTP